MFEVSEVYQCKLVPVGTFRTLKNAEHFCSLFVESHFVISEVDKDGNYICDIVKEITPQID